jgi:hypothetical protein
VTGIRVHSILRCPYCGKKYSETYMAKHVKTHLKEAEEKW